MKRLKTIFPEFQIMTIQECLEFLNWKTEKNFKKIGETGQITCDCGGKVKIGGWIGGEHAWCPECHKGMQDLTGFLPVADKSCLQYIDYEKIIVPKNGRHWVAKNLWNL